MTVPRLFHVSIAALWLACLASGALAQNARAVAYDGSIVDWTAIVPVLQAYRDSTRELSLDQVQTEAFEPLGRDVADFGYTKDVVWLRFGLRNTTDQQDLVLAVQENFLQLYEVWLVPRNGPAQRVDYQDETSPFAARAILFPELTSPFTLPAGDEAEIYIRFWSGGSSELSWRVMSAGDFNAWSASRTARNFIFYGMTALLSAAAMMSYLLTRRGVFAAYASYTLAGLLFIMHADGNTFQYLWPNLPAFNAFATIPLGVFIIIGGLVFARTFLNTRHHNPRTDMVLLGMAGLAILVGLSSAVFDTQAIKRLLILMSLLTTCLLAAAGIIVARTRFREVRFYLLAWGFAFVASGVMTLRHWVGVEFSEELQYNAIRVVFLLDAALMGFAIFDRINWLKQSQKAALEASLAQANKTVELTARLHDLEQKMAIADTLAVSQERTLTETAHDIRQPLNALRLNLRELSRGADSALRMADVEETLGYLESLVSENLSNVLVADAPRVQETTEIGPIIASAVDMFDADAKAKGITLRGFDVDAKTKVPPLALMRMVTNLVSNAIKATDQGGVLVGLRRAGGVRIEVHDTGSGLSRDAFEAAGRGEGGGLGLGIVAQLAGENGVRFERVKGGARGTVLRLWLPEAGTA